MLALGTGCRSRLFNAKQSIIFNLNFHAMKKNLMWMLVVSIWTMLYSCSDSENKSSEVILTVSP